ncbi:four helix bundle protein [Siphonobacter sp. SORGH_AS_0500]|uniref:four helix bundle protein n=1 Tax=Siphonobacter sp. SORGH_AS_0500 TaxID=1864824 RepID=UPI0028584A9E|nr:four helix bundle protein [Siphonobacter sp. SORGH_AS_0500]MDR6196774.1 four helix bundle protein [Siphonobacter sp. SORGH_AS_0500]
MSYSTYAELKVWKECRMLTAEVYRVTRGFPKEELFGLTSQMRRCAVSIPSNIAEGCGRNHFRDSLQFFFISRGSLYELETQMYIASDQNYILESEVNTLFSQLSTCKKLLNGFIKYFEQLKDKQQTTNN